MAFARTYRQGVRIMLHERLPELLDPPRDAVRSGSNGPDPFPARRPAMHISETQDAVEVRAKLPGVACKDICVFLHAGRLTIHVARSSPNGKGDGCQALYRSFQLRQALDEDRATGTFQQGVLRLSLPKAEPLP
jgi:HSP20 family protein